jgi:hypothetical protein
MRVKAAAGFEFQGAVLGELVPALQLRDAFPDAINVVAFQASGG